MVLISEVADEPEVSGEDHEKIVPERPRGGLNDEPAAASTSGRAPDAEVCRFCGRNCSITDPKRPSSNRFRSLLCFAGGGERERGCKAGLRSLEEPGERRLQGGGLGCSRGAGRSCALPVSQVLGRSTLHQPAPPPLPPLFAGAVHAGNRSRWRGGTGTERGISGKPRRVPPAAGALRFRSPVVLVEAGCRRSRLPSRMLCGTAAARMPAPTLWAELLCCGYAELA